eukprot:GDKK01076952.1.p1 GENE.GDKK01076952.1~~GDKK01076952.1.p1  ORF type:complete len:481 (+),score=36.63 GDKK01076952.1:1-1443(+)
MGEATSYTLTDCTASGEIILDLSNVPTSGPLSLIVSGCTFPANSALVIKGPSLSSASAASAVPWTVRVVSSDFENAPLRFEAGGLTVNSVLSISNSRFASTQPSSFSGISDSSSVVPIVIGGAGTFTLLSGAAISINNNNIEATSSQVASGIAVSATVLNSGAGITINSNTITVNGNTGSAYGVSFPPAGFLTGAAAGSVSLAQDNSYLAVTGNKITASGPSATITAIYAAGNTAVTNSGLQGTSIAYTGNTIDLRALTISASQSYAAFHFISSCQANILKVDKNSVTVNFAGYMVRCGNFKLESGGRFFLQNNVYTQTDDVVISRPYCQIGSVTAASGSKMSFTCNSMYASGRNSEVYAVDVSGSNSISARPFIYYGGTYFSWINGKPSSDQLFPSMLGWAGIVSDLGSVSCPVDYTILGDAAFTEAPTSGTTDQFGSTLAPDLANSTRNPGDDGNSVSCLATAGAVAGIALVALGVLA